MISTQLVPVNRTRSKPRGLGFAVAGMLLGLLYATVSVYWGLGGTALLDTVGASLGRGGGGLVVVLALWAAVVLKAIAAVLPLTVIYHRGGATWQRLAKVSVWIEAAVLVAYGLVLSTAGLMVQLGIIHASASADRRALAWHAYLWDPWFLLWGLLVVAALLRARHGAGRPRN
ncbi:MAG: DUF3995 domain-containing protein [Trebonia sp.]